MIRGKKNYLPPCQLIMGLGFMFRLEESSIERHKDERRVRTLEDENEESFTEIDKEIEIEDDEEGIFFFCELFVKNFVNSICILISSILYISIFPLFFYIYFRSPYFFG